MSADSSDPRWRIPLSRPDIDESDRRAVLAVLESSCLSLGPELDRFERDFTRHTDGRPAVAVSSGTAGLYLALRALGVDGGEVITPSLGFVATAHAIRLSGATPHFVDVSPSTLCVTPETIEAGWTERTRAVLPVDLYGTPTPAESIAQLARERGVPVVEDSCEALGSQRQGRPVGTHGDAGVFAFYPNKQMTTGEGGMIVARDDALADGLRSARNQGRGQGEFEFLSEGFNFRLSEMQAALGRSQLSRLEDFLGAREAVAAAYESRLREVPGIATLPGVDPGDRRSWFVFPVFVAEADWRRPLRDALAGRGIQTSPYFRPVHGLAPYRDCPHGATTVTDAVSARSFAIPFHNRLSPDEIHEVADTIAGTLDDLASGSELLSLQTLLAAAT